LGKKVAIWLIWCISSFFLGCRTEGKEKAFPVATSINSEVVKAAAALASDPPKMVWIQSCSFQMGSHDPSAVDAQPIHEVRINDF